MKTTLSLLFTNTGSSNNVVNLDGRKVTSVSIGVVGRKVKNLSKIKNIKKLAKSKKPDFIKTKANEAFGTDL